MDQAMQEQAVQGPQDQAPQSDADVFTVEGARAKMNMPKDLQPTYVRIVEAGMKLMFDQRTRDGTIAFLEEPGDMATKLAEGVTAVMAVLFKESNGTMPPQLVIPCGVELLLHVAAVANKGGMNIDNNTIAEAMANLVESIMKLFKVDASVGGMVGKGATEEPAESEEPGEVEEPVEEGGLIQGAMR